MEGSNITLVPESSSTVVIVTYGNGVPTALSAVDLFFELRSAAQGSALSAAATAHAVGGKEASSVHRAEVITVVDCPCLSQLPAELEAVLSRSTRLHSVIFADVCKVSGAPLSAFAVQLQNKGAFCRSRSRGSVSWAVIGASNTYNPLGNTLTFLSSKDVLDALYQLVGRNEGLNS